MATFDIAAARKDGHSDAEIAGFLARQKDLSFDVGAALKDGHSPTEVLDAYGRNTPQPQPKEDKPSVLADIAKQVPSGLVEGAVGVPELGAGMVHGVAKALSTLGDYLPESVVREAKRAVGAASALRDIAGDKPRSITELPARIPEMLPEAKTPAGTITRAATGAVPATAALGVPSAIRAGLMGGAASEGTSQALEGSPFQGVASLAAGAAAGGGGPAALDAAATVPRALAKLGPTIKTAAPYAATLALDATHGGGLYTMGKIALDITRALKGAREEAPLTSRFAGTPSVGDAAAPAAKRGPIGAAEAFPQYANFPPVAPGAYDHVPQTKGALPPVEEFQTLKSHPEPIVSPAPAEGNPALAKAREHAKVMNALAELAKQNKFKQGQSAEGARVLEDARHSTMNPGISRLTPEPNAEMAAGALQGAAGTPMTPGVARLSPEPVPAPVAAPPAPTALPRDVASQGKLLSSGMLKVAKMREAAAKAEATPIEKIIEKVKAPKEAPKPEGVTLDETLGAPKGTFTPTESDYAHMNLQDAARHIVEAQKAKGIKFWHAEDSYIKATAGRLGAKGVIASKVAKVVGVPELTLKSWVQGAKTRTDATALRDHLKSLANKSNHGVIDAAFKEGLKQGWSK